MLRMLREKGFFHLVGANSIAQLLAFVSGLVITKLLTPGELGQARIIQSYTTVLVVLGGIGMGPAILKFASEERSKSEVDGTFSLGLRRSFLAGAALAIVFALVSLFTPFATSPTLAVGLACYAAMVPFSIATDLGIQFMQAQRRPIDAAKLMLSHRSTVFLMSIVGVAIFGFWGFVGAGVLSWIMGALLAVRKAGRAAVSAPSYQPTGFQSFAWFAWLSALIFAINQYTDFFVLDRLISNREAIGHYAFASLFVVAAGQFNGVMQAIFIPTFSSQSHDWKAVRHQAMKIQAFYALAAVGVASVMIALVWLLTSFAFPRYADAHAIAAILVWRFAVAAGATIVGAASFALGEVRFNVIAQACSAVTALGASWFLGVRYGVIGVAWGQVVGAAVFCIAQWLAFGAAMRVVSRRAVAVVEVEEIVATELEASQIPA